MTFLFTAAWIIFSLQLPDQNVLLIQNAPITLHVSEKNAWTLAPLARVEWMLNVGLPDTEPFVFAAPVLKAILTGFAKSVRLKYLYNLLSQILIGNIYLNI